MERNLCQLENLLSQSNENATCKGQDNECIQRIECIFALDAETELGEGTKRRLEPARSCSVVVVGEIGCIINIFSVIPVPQQQLPQS